MEITKRELIASVSIIAVLLLIGTLVSGEISDSMLDKNEIYNKALKIESQELFLYGMRTNVGNAFVYGEYCAVDTVTYPEIGGGFMYIEKVKERYTMHTRTVTHTRTVNGHTQTYTTTENYWTWDRVWSEDLHCNKVSFCGVIFDANKIKTPEANYIDTIRESSSVRYKYYGTPTEFVGTIFTVLRDGTISNKSPFYNNKTIPETVDSLEESFPLWIFWIVWVILMGFCIYGFFYLKNKWLE